MILLAAFLTGAGDKAFFNFSSKPSTNQIICTSLLNPAFQQGVTFFCFSVTSPLAPLTPHQLDVVADLGDLVRHISTKIKISIMSEYTRKCYYIKCGKLHTYMKRLSGEGPTTTRPPGSHYTSSRSQLHRQRAGLLFQ